MEVGCVTFGMKRRKKLKQHARDNSLQGWNDVAIWRDFKPPYILEDIWPQYIQHVTFEQFTRCSQSGANNQNWQIQGSVTMHTSCSVPFIAYAKKMVRLILIKSIIN
jgi:hypothetical protein